MGFVAALLQLGVFGAEEPLATYSEPPKDPRILFELGEASFTTSHKVEEIRWSADGRWLFTAERYHHITSQFDAKTGKLARCLMIDRPVTIGDAMIGLEKTEMAMGKPYRFGCWSFDNLVPRWVIPEIGQVLSMAVSPDGKSIAVCLVTSRRPQPPANPLERKVMDYRKAQEPRFVLIEVASGKELWAAQVNQSASEVAFVGNNLLLAKTGTFEVFDASTGQRTGKLADRRGATPDPAMSIADADPSTGTVLLVGQKDFQLWRVTSGTDIAPTLLIRAGEEELFQGGALSLADDSIIIRELNGTRVYGRKDRGRFRKVSPAGEGWAMDPARSRLAYGYRTRLTLVPADTWRVPVATDPFPNGIKRIEFSPDGSLLAVSVPNVDVNVGEVMFFESQTGKFAGKLPSRLRADGSFDFHFHPDGKSLLTMHPHGLRQWEIPALRSAWTESPKDPNVNGKQVLALSDGLFGGMMYLKSSANGKQWGLLDARETPFLFELPASGVLDASRLLNFTVSKQQISPATKEMVISPDGTRLALTRIDALEIYDIETRSLEHQFPKSAGFVEFAPDGQSIAQLDPKDQRQLAIRNLESGEVSLTLPLRGPDGVAIGVGDVAFSPNGDYLVATAGNAERTWAGLVVWNVRTGKEVARVNLPRGGASGVAIHPAGKRLATVNRDRTISIWNFEGLVQK